MHGSLRVRLADAIVELSVAVQQKTSMHILRRWVGAVLIAALAASHAAISAQQDEIQVYADDINKRGEFGLEWHLNTTPEGRTKPDYPGEITNNHGFRFTPEFSYGLTSDVELGLYLLMLVDGAGDYHFVGAKYRLKWLPLRPNDDAEGWFLGANTELSRVGYKFSESPWTTELRPIIGYKGKDLAVRLKPDLGLGSVQRVGELGSHVRAEREAEPRSGEGYFARG